MVSFDAEGVTVRIDEDTLREIVEDPVALAAWCRAHPEDPRTVAYLRMLGRLDEAGAAGRASLAAPGLDPLVRAVRRARYASVLQWQGAFDPAEEQFALAAEETGLADPTTPSSLSVLAGIFQHRAKNRFEHGRAERAQGNREAATRLRRSAIEDARRALALHEHLPATSADALASSRQTLRRLDRAVGLPS